MTAETIKAYKTDNRTGWAAVDRLGRTRAISEQEAADLPQAKPFETLAKERGLSRPNTH